MQLDAAGSSLLKSLYWGTMTRPAAVPLHGTSSQSESLCAQLPSRAPSMAKPNGPHPIVFKIWFPAVLPVKLICESSGLISLIVFIFLFLKKVIIDKKKSKAILSPPPMNYLKYSCLFSFSRLKNRLFWKPVFVRESRFSHHVVPSTYKISNISSRDEICVIMWPGNTVSSGIPTQQQQSEKRATVPKACRGYADYLPGKILISISLNKNMYHNLFPIW